MVGFHGSSLGGSRPLRDLIDLLSLEGTSSRIAGSVASSACMQKLAQGRNVQDSRSLARV